MTFTDAHSNSAVCTPTRYGILTGRYCFRSRLKSGVLGGYDPLLIEPGRMTIASMLKRHGYHTACIGKWHLGLGWQSLGGKTEISGWGQEGTPPVDFAAPLTAGPHTVGFDHSFIVPASLDIPPYVFIEDGRVVGPPPEGECEASGRPAFWRKGAITPGIQHETTLLELTRRSEAYINDQASRHSNQPFFLYFPMTSPHTPHLPRKPFVGQSQAGPYGDFVAEHDWSIGQILMALQRNGLADETLVIVTSDNGAHVRGSGFDLEKAFGHRSNFIYRGQKSDAWDGGHRVPLFVRWPGRVKPGSRCDQTVCLTDMMATLAELLGDGPFEDAGEDSQSMLPLLRGSDSPARQAVVHHSVDGQFAIRSDRWKLIDCPGSGGWSLPAEQVPADQPPRQLYDMHNDPEEQRNLIDENNQIADRLQSMLDSTRTG